VFALEGSAVLTVKRMHDRRDGQELRGFWVANSRGHGLALGAVPTADDPGFVVMRAKRYERDLDLCRKVRQLTGMTPRGVAL
jgi:hypothetical protein